MDEKNLDVHFDLARAYGQIGEVDLSIKHHKIVLKMKPNTLQVTVVRNYVNMLIENGRFKKAKKVIARYRAKSGQSQLMSSEWKMASNN